MAEKKTTAKKATTTKKVVRKTTKTTNKPVTKQAKSIQKKSKELQTAVAAKPKTTSKKLDHKNTFEKEVKKVYKNGTWILSLILFVIIIVGVLGYLNYKNSVEQVLDYYSTNDQRRSESVYADFDAESPQQKVVLTKFGVNYTTFSLVHESTDNNNEIFVETFYLKRSNPIKFEVTKSFRNIVTGMEFDEVVKLARSRDLHLDNPDENQTEIISVRDLDLTPAQQEQAAQQQAAQEEQRKAQEEYEALPIAEKITRLEEQVVDIEGFITAVENGETTYNGQEIPAGVDPNYLQQVLQGTLNEIERLKSLPEEDSAETGQTEGGTTDATTSQESTQGE